MVEFAAVTYGLLMSFVFSSLHTNERRAQPTPAIMVAVGYFLCGVSATLAACLVGLAGYQLLH